jgi:hypothetical protein
MLEVLYKIPSRILAARLNRILPTIIGPHQHGFMMQKGFFNRTYRLFLNTVHYYKIGKNTVIMKYKYIRRCMNLMVKRVLLVRGRPPPPTHKKNMLLFWNDRRYVTLSKEVRIL